LTKSGKAARHRFLDMHPHRQVTVNVDAEIADGLHWSDVDAVNQHSSGWKLMLAPACRAPQNLGLLFIVQIYPQNLPQTAAARKKFTGLPP